MVQITADAALKVHLQGDDIVVPSSTLKTGYITIGTRVTPIIFRTVTGGELVALTSDPTHISVMIVGQEPTEYKKKGFVDVLITTKPVQFFAYIHIDRIEQFMSSLTMAGVRALLT